MAKRVDTTAARLKRLCDLCDTLPGTKHVPAGQGHRSFAVGRKTFAWYMNNHHGDGMIVICCKSTLARQRELVGRDPVSYCVPAYVGNKGWVSLRLDLPRVDWEAAIDLFVAAYRMQAPRRLIAKL